MSSTIVTATNLASCKTSSHSAFDLKCRFRNAIEGTVVPRHRKCTAMFQEKFRAKSKLFRYHLGTIKILDVARDELNFPGFILSRVWQTSKKFECQTLTTLKSMGAKSVK